MNGTSASLQKTMAVGCQTEAVGLSKQQKARLQQLEGQINHLTEFKSFAGIPA